MLRPSLCVTGAALAAGMAFGAQAADVVIGVPNWPSVSATANHHGASTTTVDSDAVGGDAAVGVSLGLAFVDDSATATTGRNITANGDVSFGAHADGSSIVTVKAVPPALPSLSSTFTRTSKDTSSTARATPWSVRNWVWRFSMRSKVSLCSVIKRSMLSTFS